MNKHSLVLYVIIFDDILFSEPDKIFNKTGVLTAIQRTLVSSRIQKQPEISFNLILHPWYFKYGVLALNRANQGREGGFDLGLTLGPSIALEIGRQ